MAERRRSKDNQKESEESRKAGEDGTKKLVMSDSLKSALMTHMDISLEQIEALVKEAERSLYF